MDERNDDDALPPPLPSPDVDESALVWENLTEDGGVRKAVTRKALGAAPQYADPGMELKVHYTGTVPGEAEPFDCSRKRKTAFAFELGAGSVIQGWDVAFQRVAVGERALLEVSSKYAYGPEGHPPTIPPDATLRFDVELLKASTKKRDLHMMKDDEKLFTAKGHKEKGLRAYAEKDWKAARREFAEAIHYCDAASYNRRDDKTMPADVADVWLSSHLNASQCALNAKDWPAANAYATRAVKADPENVKALYRRGVARSNMGLLEEARDDLREAARLDPKNRAVRAEWVKLKQKFSDQAKSQKETFAGALGKVSLFKDKPSNVAEPSTTSNPYVFMRVRAVPRGGDEAGSSFEGTLAFRVYADACPKTAKNFLALVDGGRKGRDFGSSLSYAGTPIHRIARDFMIQGGDVHKRDGTSGESIYGQVFPDEHLRLTFDRPGRLAMANRGPNTNHSQWFVTCDSAPHCDGKYVVFGELISGMSHVKRVAALDVDDKDAPKDYTVVVQECGRLEKEKAEALIADEAAKARAIADLKAKAKAADENAAAAPAAATGE